MKKIFLPLLVTVIVLLNGSFAQNNNNQTHVPAWSKDAVWYQIFPERFSNGDKSNDPAPGDNGYFVNGENHVTFSVKAAAASSRSSKWCLVVPMIW